MYRNLRALVARGRMMAREGAIPEAKPRPWSGAAVASLLLLGLVSCGGGDAPAGDHEDADHAHTEELAGEHGDEGEHEDIVLLNADQQRAAGLRIATAELSAGASLLDLPAEIRLDPDRVARVSTPISGTVSALNASEGDLVRAGQTIAVLASRELAGLKAEYMDAVAAERLSQSEADRAEALWSQDAISEAAVQTARASLARVRAEREAAETKLHAIDIDHDVLDQLDAAEDGARSRYRLAAPISGQVIERMPTLGELVGSGETADEPLFVIADASVVWADIAVYAQDLSHLTRGASVSLLDARGDEMGGGVISFISPIVDEVSRTTTARVVVENAEGRLMPGQFLTARIETGASAPVIRIPEGAVQTVEGRPSVFVPHEDGFEPQPVTVGAVARGEATILAGLAEGDAYVAEGAFTLKAELEKAAFGDDHAH